MKDPIIYLLLLLSIFSTRCKDGRNTTHIADISPDLLSRIDTTRIRMDKEIFEKEKENFYRYSYFYEDESGKQQYFTTRPEIPDSIPENKIYYSFSFLSENELLKTFYTFYPDGSLYRKGSEFYGKGSSYFPIGQTITYDKQGNITSIHDWDEEYPYPLEEVINILEKKELSFGYKLRKEKGCYIYSTHWRVVKIDGKTGKILLDIHRSTPDCGNFRRN